MEKKAHCVRLNYSGRFRKNLFQYISKNLKINSTYSVWVIVFIQIILVCVSDRNMTSFVV